MRSDVAERKCDASAVEGKHENNAAHVIVIDRVSGGSYRGSSPLVNSYINSSNECKILVKIG
jgi:hypothetical protein